MFDNSIIASDENIKIYVEELCKDAKLYSKAINNLETPLKNSLLLEISKEILLNKSSIIEANIIDVEEARKANFSESLIDRLVFSEKRIIESAKGLESVAALEDPIGKVDTMWKRPNGLIIGKMRVPLGVIGIIYEARPNVTIDAAALCLKSGNSVILKGGSDAFNTNKAIVQIIKNAICKFGLPQEIVQFIDIKDRRAVNYMMKLNEYLDVIIPRGSRGLIQNVVQNSTVPVIETGIGNCHIFVDSSANFKMAEEIIINAKTQRPGVCNATESLVIHEDVAEFFLPQVAISLFNKGVELRVCDRAYEILSKMDNVKITHATKDDWSKEYLDLILSIKVVDSLNEAIEHINKYNTGHSESIITENYSNAQKFLKEIDAAAVYVNASTRFTDGCEFGFGAEIGISTQKLHARGPMGLNELTTSKYIIYGNGQIR